MQDAAQFVRPGKSREGDGRKKKDALIQLATERGTKAGFSIQASRDLIVA